MSKNIYSNLPVYNFNTIGEFIDESQRTPQSKRDSSVKRGDWSGSKDMAETLDIADNGYELDMIDTILEGIRSNEAIEVQPYYDVSGCEVNVGLYLSGEPECMLEYNVQEATNFIHIVMGVVESAFVDKEQILNRAAAMTSIVDNLENNGYRVKLSMVIANQGGFTKTQHLFTLVGIKDYQEHMDIARVAGILHPGFYRRLIFCYWEGHKDGPIRGGYGYPASGASVYSKLKDIMPKDEEFVYLPSLCEASGGGYAHNLRSEFEKIEDAKNYADAVAEMIMKGQVQ